MEKILVNISDIIYVQSLSRIYMLQKGPLLSSYFCDAFACSFNYTVILWRSRLISCAQARRVNPNVRIAGVTQLSHQFDYVVDRLPLEQASICVRSFVVPC